MLALFSRTAYWKPIEAGTMGIKYISCLFLDTKYFLWSEAGSVAQLLAIDYYSHVNAVLETSRRLQ